MWFFAAAIGIVVAIFVQSRVYKKRGFDGLNYRAGWSSEEVFEGDDVYMYEELSNDKRLPLPYVKVDTDLPEGLTFTILKPSEEGGVAKIEKSAQIQSMFSMKGETSIQRRWRVNCEKRGVYNLDGAIVVVNDIFGLNGESRKVRLSDEDSLLRRLVVLPTPLDLETHFTSSDYMSGDVVKNHCPVTDPLLMCGLREYSQTDPMNRINWKSSASHGQLLVNLEERTVRPCFAVLLNMNSREIEQIADRPSDTASIELNISVCTSLLDRIAAEDIPVRLIMNSIPEERINLESDSESYGEGISVSKPFKGKQDTVLALRMLATLPMTISTPADKMFDYIASHIEQYRDCENLIIVTAYLDQRMLNLHAILRRAGIDVIFYVTTSRNYVISIPEGVEVYYRTY